MAIAINNYEQFLDLAVKSGDCREESHVLMNLCFAYYDLGDLERAKLSLEYATALRSLGTLQLNQGEYERALTVYIRGALPLDTGKTGRSKLHTMKVDIHR